MVMDIFFALVLFFIVLPVAIIILVYGLAASVSVIVLLWVWVRGLWGKGNLLVQAIIIYFVFMASMGVLALLGVGR